MCLFWTLQFCLIPLLFSLLFRLYLYKLKIWVPQTTLNHVFFPSLYKSQSLNSPKISQSIIKLPVSDGQGAKFQEGSSLILDFCTGTSIRVCFLPGLVTGFHFYLCPLPGLCLCRMLYFIEFELLRCQLRTSMCTLRSFADYHMLDYLPKFNFHQSSCCLRCG